MKQLLLSFFAFSLLAAVTGCTDYGDKVSKGHIDMYYKDGIAKENAELTAEVLYYVDTTYQNDTSETKSFQLVQQNDTITFRMVVLKDRLEGIDDNSFLAIGNLISQQVFENKPVNVELTDDRFNTFRKLSFVKLEEDDLPEVTE